MNRDAEMEEAVRSEAHNVHRRRQVYHDAIAASRLSSAAREYIRAERSEASP